MRIFLLGSLILLFLPSFSEGELPATPGSDSSIRSIFSAYQQALISRDATFPQKSFISDTEFKQILDLVKKKQPNCIGSDENHFSTETNRKLYDDIITSKVEVNAIFVNRIEYNYSCGNLLEIPRVICSVRYAGNRVVDVPFLLVKTKNNEYKILRNFLNYKLFSNE